MNYYDDIKNARDYINRAKGFDGSAFLPIIRKYLSNGSSLLELGMGPGTDVDLFSEFFSITGSDNSQAFLDIYKEKNPNAKLLLLDAISIHTNQKFDGIYSNKVLHLLSIDELKKSFQNQLKCLNKNGVVFHTFWLGTGEMEFGGLKYNYYNEDSIQEIISSQFEILEFKKYIEMDDGDSFYLVMKK